MSDGVWIRKTAPRPKHVCAMPERAEDRDVWMCGPCKRIYIWSNGSTHGIWWRRVWFRYWWFRAFHPRPTQETDPKDNARCPSCRCAEGDGSPCPDIDCPDRWHAQETDPG